MSQTKGFKKTRKLINAGVEIAGGAVGGALGFLAGGPLGAAALGAGGTAISKTLIHIGDELSERLLGPRELTRIGATLALATKEISERIKNGENVRSDGFFEYDESGRSKADELSESVLLKSQREPEEKKIPLLAHLLANISFSTEISVSLGEQMIKAVEQLTYRQLCILRLAAINEHFKLRKTDYRGSDTFPREVYQLMHECYDLYNRGFISNAGHAALGITDIAPAGIRPQGLGADIHNWMQLWQIPIEDIQLLADVLSDTAKK
ncbi:MAG: hypothetical protein COU67_00485 [Candidatus Pacebacteria bacterium CG10_big_fil_rev_8_21_14_0_10_44_54]|nr:MAG: hypothetical protein COU67_00485 [Candidatus Pacebacteria bacterium CG10_big_fil_rev_8_21_14_0_10_44_54]